MPVPVFRLMILRRGRLTRLRCWWVRHHPAKNPLHQSWPTVPADLLWAVVAATPSIRSSLPLVAPSPLVAESAPYFRNWGRPVFVRSQTLGALPDVCCKSYTKLRRDPRCWPSMVATPRPQTATTNAKWQLNNIVRYGVRNSCGMSYFSVATCRVVIRIASLPSAGSGPTTHNSF